MLEDLKAEWDRIKVLSEEDLEKRASETASQMAANWGLEWGRIVAKFCEKTGLSREEALLAMSALQDIGNRQDYQEERARVAIIRAKERKRAAEFDAHLLEVSNINQRIDATNRRMLEVLDRVEPVLHRMARPWYLRLFA